MSPELSDRNLDWVRVEVRNVRWVGIRTDRYEAMGGFLRLSSRVDVDDPTAGELHERAEAHAASAVQLRRPQPIPLRGRPPDLARARRCSAVNTEPLPQPWTQARRDDNGIEASLHRKLCDGTLTLRQAQAQEAAYKRRFG